MTPRLRLLNVGAGDWPLPGFLNLDRAPGADVRLDAALSLPFRTSAVDAIYCEHFLEHLSQAEGAAFLRECRRVLRPQGVLRVVTPDLAGLVRQYWSPHWRDAEWDRHGYDWLATPCEMLNLALRAWGHRWVYDEEELVRLARLAGLTPCRRYEPGQSQTPALRGLEHRGGPQLIVEFVKARTPDPDPTPLVSVLIPAFKPRHFRAALESVLAQTYRPLEIVVSDDSPDDTIGRIVSATAAGDVRLVYLRNPRPLGELANTRQALAHARGAYVKILHDDDRLLPACLARQVAVLRADPDVTLVTAHRALIDADDQPLPEDDTTRRPVPCDARLDGESVVNVVLAKLCNFIGEPSATLFRRRDVPVDLWSFAGRSVPSNTDVALWLSLLSQGDLAYLTETLCLYRRHPRQQQRERGFLERAGDAWAQMRADGLRLGFLRGPGPWPLRWRPLGPPVSATARLELAPASTLERVGWALKRLEGCLGRGDAVGAWRLAVHALDLLHQARAEFPGLAEDAAAIEATLGATLEAVAGAVPVALRRQRPAPCSLAAATGASRPDPVRPAPDAPAPAGGETPTSGARGEAAPAGVPPEAAVTAGSDGPATTVIVRTRGDVVRLGRCLAGLAASRSDTSVEVLVVADGPAGAPVGELRAVVAAHGARLLVLDGAPSAARALNAAAHGARGRFLVFLHDDVVPRPGWLDALRAPAEADPAVGVVGAKLLIPGTLQVQHAGLAFGATRTPYPLYQGWNADHPAVDRPRVLRAVSGACLLVRRAEFLAVGGFDETYTDGFEDVDLCLRYGERGAQVVYAPGAVLEHADLELVSTDPARSEAARTGLRRLLERWGHTLAADAPAQHAADGLTVELRDGGAVVAMEPGAVHTTVVMVTYNSALDLPDCLRTLLDLGITGEPVELVVIDNASSDGTRSLLAALAARQPNVTLILNDDNRGFARAVNQGLRAASGRWVVLLNPDTRLAPGWLARLRAHAGPDVGAVGPVSNGAGGAQAVRRYLPDWDGAPEAATAARLAAAHAGRAVETRALTFFCTLFPRAVFDRVGLLDEDFFLNQEDLEFCLRLRLAGYRLLVATDAYVHHLGGGSKLSLAPTRQLALHAEATRILLQKLTARFGDDVPPLDTLWGDVALGEPPAPR